MSCGCNNNGYGGYGSVCPDIPYPQISAESVPSLISNLTFALYGLINKSVANGRIKWTIPCDPNSTATILNIPRNVGEGLLCYFIRVFQSQSPAYPVTTTPNLILQSTTTLPTWVAQNTLSVGSAAKATNLINSIVGSIPYTSGSNVTSFLSPASTGGYVLSSQGANQPPIWIQNTAVTTSANTVLGGSNGQILQSTGISSSTWVSPSSISITSTGSTTPRTLANRFAEVVNVKDFGAVGDGATDDTAAIQAAINAAVSIGNAIVEFPPKTYLVSTLTVSQACPSWNVACFLSITGGTSSLKITLKGNGSIIYTNTPTPATPISPATQAENYMLYAATYFDSVKISDLTFTRGPLSLPAANLNGSAGGVRFHPVDNTEVGTISITGCKFINQHWAVDIINKGIESSAFGKLKKLFIDRCDFLYPYGATSSQTNAGGGQTIRINGWVKEGNYSNCFAEGITGGILPSGVTYPKDGFTIGCAIRSTFTNCKFVNYWVEVLQHVPNNNSPCLLSSFTQPAIGGSVTVNIQYIWQLQSLYVGKTYTIICSSGSQTASGIYTLTNWNGLYGTSGQVTLLRLDDSLLGFGAENWSAIATSSTVPVGDFVQTDNLKGFSLEVTNCQFGDGSYIYNSDGSLCTLGGYFNGSGGGTPAIAAGTLPIIATGNVFNNCNGTLVAQYAFCASIPAPATFSNNQVFLSPKLYGDAGGVNVTVCTSGSIVSENEIISDDSSCIVSGSGQAAVVYLNANNCFAVNNSFLNRKVVSTTHPTYGISAGNNSSSISYNATIQYNTFTNYDGAVRTFNLTTDGTNQGVFLKTPTWLTRNQKLPFNPTKNGWVRLNYLGVYGLSNFAATINFFNLKFEVSGGSGSSGLITVLRNTSASRNTGVSPMSAIRVVGASSSYVDVYVNSYTLLQPPTSETGYVYSTTETGFFNLQVKESSVITGIGNAGTGYAVITSASHGLSNGDAIYISGSNSTPSVDGGYIVSSVAQNTFVITKTGLSITVAGTAGEYLYNPPNNPNDPISLGVTVPISTKTSFISSLGTGDFSGSGIPSTVPVFFGQGYYDTTNAKWYKAIGVQYSSDWVAIS